MRGRGISKKCKDPKTQEMKDEFVLSNPLADRKTIKSFKRNGHLNYGYIRRHCYSSTFKACLAYAEYCEFSTIQLFSAIFTNFQQFSQIFSNFHHFSLIALKMIEIIYSERIIERRQQELRFPIHQ